MNTINKFLIRLTFLLFNHLNSSNATTYQEIKLLSIEKGIYTKKDGVASLSFFLEEPAGVNLNNYPIQGSIPLKKGELYNPKMVRLIDENGKELSVQCKALNRWKVFDKPSKSKEKISIKWLLLNFRTNLKSHKKHKFILQYGKGIFNKVDNSKILVKKSRSGIEVATNALQAKFSKSGVLNGISIQYQGQWIQQLKSPMEIFADINYKELPKYNQWTLLAVLDGKRQWKFAIEQNELESRSWAQPNFNDSNWEYHNPAQSWENQGYPEHEGYAWYRTTFNTKKSWNKREIYLEFRYPDWWSYERKYWIYLNGELQGELSPKTKKINGHYRIKFNNSVFKESSENHLAIRAYDAGDGIGGLVCKPYIRAKYNKEVDGPRIEWSGRYSNLNDQNSEVRILEEGPEKVVVYTKGWLTNKEQRKVTQYRCFYTFYQNQQDFDFTYNFTTTHNPAQFRYDTIGVRLPLMKYQNPEAIFGGELGDLNSWYRINLKEHERLSLYQYHDGPSRYPGIPTLVENKLNLKYQILSKNLSFAEGKKSQGWAGITNGKASAVAIVKDFWQSYPSEIAIERDTNALLAYMWPKESKELDLRNWGDKKDGSWDKVEKAAENGDKVLKKIFHFSQNPGFTYKGDALPYSNSLGRGWTRKFKFKFSSQSFQEQHLPELAKAYQYTILPFSSSQYNCRTGALAYELHPYDPVNFPVFENAWNASLIASKKVTFDRLKIFGMFHYGAMMLRFYENKRTFHHDCKRRWAHQESGYSPSLAPIIQYFRTGHRPYFEYAEALAKFAMDVSIRNYHMIPTKMGYAGKHELNVFSGSIPCHTNLEGISNYYLLTGDSRTQVFLEERNSQYQKETMYTFSKRGKPLDRVHDGALFNRIIVWNVLEDPKMKTTINNAFEFFRRRHREGYTSRGSVSYTKRRMTSAWYYLRSPICLEFLGDPVVLKHGRALTEHFLKDTIMTNYEYFNFNIYKHAKSIKEMKKLIDPLKINGSRSQHLRPLTGDHFSGISAYYRSNFPIITHSPLEIQKRFGPHFWIRKKLKSYELKEGYSFESIGIRKLVNQSPYDIFEDKSFNANKLYKEKFGLYHIANDQAKDFTAQIGKRDFLWDFGSLSHVAKGHIGIHAQQKYPFWKGYEIDKNFTGFPFGAKSKYAGVDFELIDPATNQNRAYLELNRGDRVIVDIDQKASRLFFLGQVKKGGLDFHRDKGVNYTIHYEDGSKKKLKLEPGVHFDASYNFVSAVPKAATAQYARRSVAMGQYLHFNVFAIKLTQSKLVKNLEIQSETDSFCIFAITAEVKVKKQTDDNSITDIQVPESYTPGEMIISKLNPGWYDLNFEMNPVTSDHQIFLEVNGVMLSAGFLLPKTMQLSFPIYIKNKLTIKAHVSGWTKPGKFFKSITASKFKQAVAWTKKRKKVKSLFKYGLQNSGSKNRLIESFSGFGMIDHPDKNNLLSDYIPISGKDFCAEVPNGTYEVSLLLFSPLEQNYEVDINGLKTKTFLPKNYFRSFEEIKCHSYTTLKAYVKIKDKFLKIKFPNSNAEKISYQATPYFNQFVGIRALILKHISNSRYKKELGI